MAPSPSPKAPIGRRLTLSDAGEGWFTDGDITGVVESYILSSDGSPYYVVRLNSPLEVQESGAATPSGFILRHYSHWVIYSRLEGYAINYDTPVPVYVWFVQTGTPVPKNMEDMAGMKLRAWASCIAHCPDAHGTD